MRPAERVSRGGAALAALLLLVLQFCFPAHAGPLAARGFKMAGDAVRTRVVLSFDGEPDVRWFLLRAPHRLVVDLPETRFAIEPAELKARGLVEGVRFGSPGEGASRLVFTGKGPFAIERFEILRNETAPGYRMVVDMVASSEAAFENALAVQLQTTGSTVAGLDSEAAPTKKFTIVVDPGHGGVDGGARGVNGTVEKEFTLLFAGELKQRLLDIGSFDVFTTRSDDRFLGLDERVRIAREHGADLLISVHADTIRLKGIHGATVYTVADKASDEEAKALAERENDSDLLGGVPIPRQDPEVADILLDLIRRETHQFSVGFARSLVGQLKTNIDLIKNPHRFAGFRVLRAPDIPSVLVEVGYLSNLKDETRLRDPLWRGRVIDSMVEAVSDFAARRTASGG